MKSKTVYMCKNGHLFYGETPPEKCKHCGDTNFGLIVADEMEENIGDTEKSRNDNN